MSDDEDQVIGSEEEEESEEESAGEEEPAPKSTGPTEAQMAMERRREKQTKLAEGLDEAAQEVLEASRLERERMEDEIQELRLRSEQRKKEREAEERKLAVKRAEEDALRRQLEEERAGKKKEEENRRMEMREARLAEYEKRKTPKGRNFVIKKKEGEEGGEEEEEEEEDQATKDRKSREQQEQERRAILAQRIKEIKYNELDTGAKLIEKSKELHAQITRLESEKYDLEKRYKSQQYDMMELAERARQMNKVGKEDRTKRIALKDDEVDKIQARFAGAPARIEMFSRYERQKDKRTYEDRHVVFHGPTWKYPAARITPSKIVRWEEDTGLPIYEELGAAPLPEQAAAE